MGIYKNTSTWYHSIKKVKTQKYRRHEGFDFNVGTFVLRGCQVNGPSPMEPVHPDGPLHCASVRLDLHGYLQHQGALDRLPDGQCLRHGRWPRGQINGYPLLLPDRNGVVSARPDQKQQGIHHHVLGPRRLLQKMGYDPEDPRCAHIIITGKILKLDAEDPEDAEEYNFAHDGLFSRHPEMKTWPANHGWFVAKMEVENILLLDYFGGAKTIEIDDYMNATM